ncbi:MAG: CdaR family transcriptional regulator [Frankiales bacterium]|nr:CdaR family transcriptional regulator [Frankiales bacterium]
MKNVSSTPWQDLPPEMSRALRPHLQAVVAEIVAVLPGEVPDYARPIEGTFGEGLRLGVGVALGRFLDLPGTSEPALTEQDRRVYLALGRGENRQGRELQTLLAAYRVGARVAFRRFATIAREADVDPDALVPLAEAVFAYIDELSATSVEGYAMEQSLRAGEADRRRSELLRLVLSGAGDVQAVTSSARLTGWTVPERVVVVVVPQERADDLGLALGRRALVGLDGDAVVAVLPDPGAARAPLDRQLAGRRAAVSPGGSVQDVPAALALARRGALLAAEGLGDPIWVDGHLATLLVHGDRVVLDLLARARLAPLDGLKPATRDRLAETLLAWLQHRGERQHVATALHVHPQTVGYRLGQLRELFGEALEDPQARFELELALRSRD